MKVGHTTKMCSDKDCPKVMTGKSEKNIYKLSFEATKIAINNALT